MKENKTLRKSYHRDCVLYGIMLGVFVAGFSILAFLEVQRPATAMVYGLIMAMLFFASVMFITITQTLEYKNEYE